MSIPDTGVKPSKSLKEHQERRGRCYDFEPLKDGERITFVTPAFDFRSGDDSRYGQHSCELVFAKRAGNKVVSCTFYTGWTVTNKRVIQDGEDIGFMCTGLYTHLMHKHGVGSNAFKSTDCPYTGGRCYGEAGSALYGDVILQRLVNEGSAGVWDEINKELAES